MSKIKSPQVVRLRLIKYKFQNFSVQTLQQFPVSFKKQTNKQINKKKQPLYKWSIDIRTNESGICGPQSIPVHATFITRLWILDFVTLLFFPMLYLLCLWLLKFIFIFSPKFGLHVRDLHLLNNFMIYSYAIKRCLLLGRKAMTNLDSI